MKKFFLLLFSLFSLISCSEKRIESPYEAKISYFDMNIYTIVPLSDRAFQSPDTKIKLSADEYKKILSCLKNRKIVKTVNQITQFNLDFLSYIDNPEDYENSISDETSDNLPVYETVPFDDYHLNVRLVLEFTNNDKIKKIVLGQNTGFVKINEKDYQIPEEDFNELVSLILKASKTSKLIIFRNENNGLMNSIVSSIIIERFFNQEYSEYYNYSIVNSKCLENPSDYYRSDINLAGGESLELLLQPGKYKITALTKLEDQNNYLNSNSDWISNELFIELQENSSKKINLFPAGKENGYSGEWILESLD